MLAVSNTRTLSVSERPRDSLEEGSLLTKSKPWKACHRSEQVSGTNFSEQGAISSAVLSVKAETAGGLVVVA